MATQEEIDNAYDIIANTEKALITEIADLAKEITEKIATIKSGQPTKGANSNARQYLSRVESTLNSVFTYDLQNMQNMYGINTQATTAPGTTNSAVSTQDVTESSVA